MEVHLKTEALEKYRTGELTPAELLAMDDHLASCRVCQNAIARDADAAQLRRELSSKHLSYEQLEAAVDERIAGGELAIVDEHLAACEDCQAEYDDLRALRGQSRHAAKAGRSPVGIWAIAAAAAVVLIAASAVWFASERKTADQAQESAGAGERIVDGGGEVAVKADGAVQGLTNLSAAQAKLVAAALTRGELPVSELQEKLRQKPGMLLSGGATESQFRVTGPVNTVVFGRPAFRWQAIPGASGYVVEVFDAAFRPVAKSPKIAGTEWAPETWADPAPDAVFYWQVTATVGRDQIRAPQPPAPQAIFGAPGAAANQSILEAKAQHGDSHLLLGLVYLQAGAMEQARSEFDALAASNPASPAVHRLRLAIQNPSPTNTKPAQ